MRPMTITDELRTELAAWNLHNKLAREVYFLERAIDAMPPDWLENKATGPSCLIHHCGQRTKSKSGICRSCQQRIRELQPEVSNG